MRAVYNAEVIYDVRNIKQGYGVYRSHTDAWFASGAPNRTDTVENIMRDVSARPPRQAEQAVSEYSTLAIRIGITKGLLHDARTALRNANDRLDSIAAMQIEGLNAQREAD